MSVYISKNSEWDSLVSGKQHVAADFWSPFCTYCSAFKPIFGSVAAYDEDINLVKLNVDQMLDIALRYGTQVVSVVRIFCERKEPGEVVGYILKDNLKKDIDKMVTRALMSCQFIVS